MNQEGGTAFCFALQQDFAELVALLQTQVETVSAFIKASANINHVRPTDGKTSLISAAQRGHFDVMELLLDARIDHTALDAIGQSALTLVSKHHRYEMTLNLLNRGTRGVLYFDRGSADYLPLERALACDIRSTSDPPTAHRQAPLSRFIPGSI